MMMTLSRGEWFCKWCIVCALSLQWMKQIMVNIAVQCYAGYYQFSNWLFFRIYIVTFIHKCIIQMPSILWVIFFWSAAHELTISKLLKQYKNCVIWLQYPVMPLPLATAGVWPRIRLHLISLSVMGVSYYYLNHVDVCNISWSWFGLSGLSDFW